MLDYILAVYSVAKIFEEISKLHHRFTF